MNKRVMIVEDNLLARVMLRDILENEGHTVIAEYAGGDEAVAAYETVKPDLVFMDIVLQNNNGIEAAKKILSLDGNAKIIIMSVLDDIPLIQASFKIGVIDFIHKPFDAARVGKAVLESNK